MVSMSLRQKASTYWSSSSRSGAASRSGSTVSSVGVHLLQLGVRPLQRGVHRGRGGLERLGGLLGRPAQDVAQDQHRPLPGRQVLERGDEGQPDRVALGDHDRRVGHRLEPRHLVVELERVAGLAVGGAETGGQRPPGAALEVGEADVGGDAVEPGAHRGATLEAVVGPPGAQVGLLDEVLGLVHGPGHPVAVREQLPPVGVRQLLEVPWRLGALAAICPAVCARSLPVSRLPPGLVLSASLPVVWTGGKGRTHRCARR